MRKLNEPLLLIRNQWQKHFVVDNDNFSVIRLNDCRYTTHLMSLQDASELVQEHESISHAKYLSEYYQLSHKQQISLFGSRNDYRSQVATSIKLQLESSM